MINKMNLKKITSACALMVAGIMTGNANAAVGWPVVNVGDAFYYNAYFGSMGIFTNAMGKQNSAIKGAIDSARTVAELQMSQATQNQHDSDVRLRMALGQADIAKRDFDQMPTLGQCAELSRGAAVGSAVSSAADRRGGGSGVSSPRSASIITNQAVSSSNSLKQRVEAGTCTPEMGGVAGCSSTGDVTAAGVDAAKAWKDALNSPTAQNKFLGADFIPYGILGNANGMEKVVKEANFANYTLKKEDFDKVADKYASDATFLGGPRVLETKEAKQRNPMFFSKYYSVLTKLSAANYVLRDIALLRLDPGAEAFPADSIAGKAYAEMKTKYSVIFPTLKAPDSPSFFELIRFNVYNDMFGNVNDMTGDSADVQEAILRKIALNNLIQLKNFENTEKTNILLSHILVQLTNPVYARDVTLESTASDSKK